MKLWFLRILIVLPPILVACGVAWLGVDVPRLDDWSRVEVVTGGADGVSTIEDLWALENEHRTFLPRLLARTMAPWTGWDLRAEMLAHVFLMTLCLGLLALHWRTKGSPLNLVLVSALLFTMHGWRNWTWGTTLNGGVAHLFAILSFVCLAARPRTMLRGIALVAAIAASWSFSSGFLVWPIGYLLLWLPREGSRHAKLRWTIAWSVGLAIALGLHLATIPPAAAPLVEGKAADLALLFTFVTRLIGSGLVGQIAPAWQGALGIAGGLSMALAVGLTAPRLRNEASARLLFAVAVFACLTMGAIAWGRSRETGLIHADASRYATVAAWPWIVAGVGAFLVASGSRTRRMATIFASLLLATSLATQWGSLQTARKESRQLKSARAALVAGEGWSWATLTALFGERMTHRLPTLGTHLGSLRQRRWTFYADATEARCHLAPGQPLAAQWLHRDQRLVLVSKGVPGAAVVLLLSSASGERKTLLVDHFDHRGSVQVGLPLRVPIPGGTAIIAASLDPDGRFLVSPPLMP